MSSVTKIYRKILKNWRSGIITKLDGKMETDGIESINFEIDKLRIQHSGYTLYIQIQMFAEMYSRVNGFEFDELMENSNFEL